MPFKDIPGYKWRYRINEEGLVQKQLADGSWMRMNPTIKGRRRTMIKMRTLENKPVEVPLVWLMADAFMGGRRPGYNIIHKNGSKLDCSVWNLAFATKSESCRRAAKSGKRKAVEKIDRDGNVVDIYSSTREAARKNYLNQSSVWARCKGKVKDPFGLDGFDYRYERS